MYVMGFYACTFPYLPLIGICALCIGFWVDKYLMFRRYCRPKPLNEDLNDVMFELLEYYPFFLALGNYIFKWGVVEINYDERGVDVIGLVMSAVFFILPADFLN